MTPQDEEQLRSVLRVLSPQSTQTVNNGSAAAVVGVLAIVIAVAAVLLVRNDAGHAVETATRDAAHAVELMAAERRADAMQVSLLLRENDQFRQRIETLEVQFRKTDGRVVALETRK